MVKVNEVSWWGIYQWKGSDPPENADFEALKAAEGNAALLDWDGPYNRDLSEFSGIGIKGDETLYFAVLEEADEKWMISFPETGTISVPELKHGMAAIALFIGEGNIPMLQWSGLPEKVTPIVQYDSGEGWENVTSPYGADWVAVSSDETTLFRILYKIGDEWYSVGASWS